VREGGGGGPVAREGSGQSEEAAGAQLDLSES
jgi:hypothetical protein